ncbi:hypothetical protein ES703_20880 [subsurface metagenome]
MRQIQKERLVLALLNEPHGTLGIPRGKLRLVGIVFDDPFALNKRQVRIPFRALWVLGPHIVRVRQAEVVVEPVSHRQEFGMMP